MGLWINGLQNSGILSTKIPSELNEIECDSEKMHQLIRSSFFQAGAPHVVRYSANGNKHIPVESLLK
jgi:hypothetical protein